MFDAPLRRAERFVSGSRIRREGRHRLFGFERERAVIRRERFLHRGASDVQRLGGPLVGAREERLRERELGALAPFGGREPIGLGEVLGGALRLVRPRRELACAPAQRRPEPVV